MTVPRNETSGRPTNDGGRSASVPFPFALVAGSRPAQGAAGASGHGRQRRQLPYRRRRRIQPTAKQPLSPPDLAHVRSHGPVAPINPQTYKLTIVNQQNKETVLSLEQLKALPDEKIMASVICAAVRRKELNALKQTKGFNTAVGGWHNGLFTGVPLHKLLKQCGVEMTPGKDQWVEFQGSENLPEGLYETCIPLHKALDPASDVLVAYEHNDEPLRHDHGHPMRIVVPGPWVADG